MNGSFVQHGGQGKRPARTCRDRNSAFRPWLTLPYRSKQFIHIFTGCTVSVRISRIISCHMIIFEAFPDTDPNIQADPDSLLLLCDLRSETGPEDIRTSLNIQLSYYFPQFFDLVNIRFCRFAYHFL